MADEQQRALIEAIFRVSRGELAQLRPAVPDTAGTVRGFRFFRIRSLFVPGDPLDREAALDERCRLLLGSASAQRQSLRILFTRSGGENSLSIGLPMDRKGAAEQLAELQNVFRGDQVLPLDGARVVAALGGLTSTAALIGVPAGRDFESANRMPTAAGSQGRSLLDRLNRYAGPESFACLVAADPVGDAAARAYHHELAEEHSQSAVHTRLAGTIHEQDRLALHYAGLLDVLLSSAERGLATGLWECTTLVLAPDDPLRDSLAGLAAGSINFGNDHPAPLRSIACPYDGADPLPSQKLNSEELATLIGLPRDERPGLRFRVSTRFSVDPPEQRAASCLNLGAVLDQAMPTGFDLNVPVDSLASHTLISGLTGSGKTTTVLHVLKQLWTSHRIPFLVIESAKREYRQLLGSPGFDDLRVFTLGDESVAPLRMNPFEILPGFAPQIHIDLLKTLFRAAFVLYPPMPEVLELALTEIYQDRGWDLTRNDHSSGTSSPRRFPTLDDLYEKTGDVVARLGYEDRLLMDIRASLRVRLDSLRLNSGKGCMLNVQTSTPLTELVDTPCILELQGLASDDEKAFLIGLVLIRLYEHFDLLSRKQSGSSGLRLLTVVEEAHRLLRRAPEGQGEVSANPRGEAVQAFGNMLAEFRSHGCGLMISEQIPSKLISDTIKNTGLKITHRIMARDDRELLSGAMGCNEEQANGLLDLDCGEAVVRTGNLHGPVLVKVPNSVAGLSAPDSDQIRKAWLKRSTGGAAGRESRASTYAVEQLIAEPSFDRLISRLLFFLAEGDADFTEVLIQLQARITALPPGAFGPEEIVQAVLTRALDRQLERRARYCGWSLDRADRLLEQSSILARRFATRGKEPPGKGRAAVLDAGRRLGQLLAAALDSANGPYDGCSICDKRCRFRYDVAAAIDERLLKRTARAIGTGNGPQVRDEILREVWALLGDDSGGAARGLATCFAVNLSQALVEGRRRVALAGTLDGLIREELSS